jgi:hypothetical protein
VKRRSLPEEKEEGEPLNHLGQISGNAPSKGMSRKKKKKKRKKRR